jgi:hypothetical protein
MNRSYGCSTSAQHLQHPIEATLTLSLCTRTNAPPFETPDLFPTTHSAIPTNQRRLSQVVNLLKCTRLHNSTVSKPLLLSQASLVALLELTRRIHRSLVSQPPMALEPLLEPVHKLNSLQLKSINPPNIHTEPRRYTAMKLIPMTQTRSVSANMKFWRFRMSVVDGGKPKRRLARRVLRLATISSCYDEIAVVRDIGSPRATSYLTFCIHTLGFLLWLSVPGIAGWRMAPGSCPHDTTFVLSSLQLSHRLFGLAKHDSLWLDIFSGLLTCTANPSAHPQNLSSGITVHMHALSESS